MNVVAASVIPDTVEAIDVHIHLRDAVALDYRHREMENLGKRFQRTVEPVSIDELADDYRSRNMMAIIMNTTDTYATGNPSVPNDHIATCVAEHPDVFIGFGAVDPLLDSAVDDVRRCAELGLRGIGELNPARQGFAPNDPACYPVWEAAQGAGMIVTFHTGFSASGAGKPGGSGHKLDLSRPIPYLDAVAADFPDLAIIGAHPGWPFERENLAVARHKSNYFIDLSGWAPKYFDPEVVKLASSLMPEKFLFGTDWPNIPIDRWMNEFADLPIKDASRQKILLDNAKRLLTRADD